MGMPRANSGIAISLKLLTGIASVSVWTSVAVSVFMFLTFGFFRLWRQLGFSCPCRPRLRGLDCSRQSVLEDVVLSLRETRFHAYSVPRKTNRRPLQVCLS